MSMGAHLARLLRQAADGHSACVAPGRPSPAGDPADLRLSLSDLLGLHGDASTAVVLVLIGLLAMLPLAGLGTVLSLGIFALAWGWVCGRASMPLPPRLGAITLNERWTGRCLHSLAWVYTQANRWMRPRWALWFHAHAQAWWGIWIALMGAVIFIPLPLGNLLPSVSLILLGLGWMFRDGLAMLLAGAVGAAGLAYAVSAWHLAAQLLVQAGHWLPF
ncbi:exopolysaccharide biosynthesis protein [Hydrogenophaga sp.]|uniref:exopolysaccharide biosynthesis protein n=1 Tax=Hydrogenophaga sp. TaxID=1904254 RepID=UPI0019997133|nr:exopolysaccharide biosynthesis protein [Hydrogenophaga sp.]MBD3893828.1 hypothetical protein [Hydrogenophaga sp.]